MNRFVSSGVQFEISSLIVFRSLGGCRSDFGPFHAHQLDSFLCHSCFHFAQHLSSVWVGHISVGTTGGFPINSKMSSNTLSCIGYPCRRARSPTYRQLPCSLCRLLRWQPPDDFQLWNFSGILSLGGPASHTCSNMNFLSALRILSLYGRAFRNYDTDTGGFVLAVTSD